METAAFEAQYAGEAKRDSGRAGCTNANNWFYAFEYMTEHHGFENLAGVTSFTKAFVSCRELRSILCDPSYDATGVSGSLMFSGCNRLVGSTGFVPAQTTAASALKFGDNGVLVDSTWALPSGCSESQTFYSSKVLVGGNGTAWSSSNVSYKYCVIDAAGSPGYLTAT